MQIATVEIRRAFDTALLEALPRLQTFFAGVIHDLEGLDVALCYISAGHVADALERMGMWHKEFAQSGYQVWAERYFEEVQRRNQFTLPSNLQPDEEGYLADWQCTVLNLIERSAKIVESSHVRL